MIVTDLTFGFYTTDIGIVHDAVAPKIGTTFTARYSDFLGGDYYYCENGKEEIWIRWNRDLDEMEEDIPGINVLVVVGGTQRGETLKTAMHDLNGIFIREMPYDIDG